MPEGGAAKNMNTDGRANKRGDMQSEPPLNQDAEITGDKGGLIWAPGVIKVGQHIMSDAATMKYVDYPRYLDGAPVNTASNGGAVLCLPPPTAEIKTNGWPPRNNGKSRTASEYVSGKQVTVLYGLWVSSLAVRRCETRAVRERAPFSALT